MKWGIVAHLDKARRFPEIGLVRPARSELVAQAVRTELRLHSRQVAWFLDGLRTAPRQSIVSLSIRADRRRASCPRPDENPLRLSNRPSNRT